MKRSFDGVSDAISEFIATATGTDLPESAVTASKRALLDAIGVIEAASGLCDEVEAFVAIARQSGRSGHSSVLGFGGCVAAPMAAFANGAMAHALDYEDAFDAAPCHPNASSIPAAVAIAQDSGPIHGLKLLTAIAIGCEVSCRVALSLRQPLSQNNWYPPPIIGAFGAVAAVASLLELTPEQVRDAISLSLCQVTAPGEIGRSANSTIRGVREAFPAQAAVLAGQLAQRGIQGFELPLEGDAGFFQLYADGQFDPIVLRDGDKSGWLIEQLSFKPWPCCRGIHSFIELALDFRRETGLVAGDIESVTVEVGQVQRMLVEPLSRKRAPATLIDAKFSIPFVVALALVRGSVGLDDFSADTLHDPAILDLAQRVKVSDNPDWGMGQATAAGMALRLGDGRELSGRVEQALGSPDRPLSTVALTEKFVDCCRHARFPWSAEEALAFADKIFSIETQADAGACFDRQVTA